MSQKKNNIRKRSKRLLKSDIKKMSDVLDILKDEYGEPTIQLNHKNPFELLVATILSAQCTDARVNIVTKDLFKKYKIPEDYLNVPIEQLEQDIYSTGYYKAKAQKIRGACETLIEDFNGDIPGNMDDLLKLPGVGRKTANVILGHSFGIPGIVVDTHVIKISNRLGVVKTKNAEKIEEELMELIPKEKWVIFTHYMINHGRKVCTARSPKCNKCQILELCQFGKQTIK